MVVAGGEGEHNHSGRSSFATTRTSVQADEIVILAWSLFLQFADIWHCVMSCSLQVITHITFVSYEMGLQKRNVT